MLHSIAEVRRGAQTNFEHRKGSRSIAEVRGDARTCFGHRDESRSVAGVRGNARTLLSTGVLARKDLDARKTSR